jgi:hypothetical protein
MLFPLQHHQQLNDCNDNDDENNNDDGIDDTKIA